MIEDRQKYPPWRERTSPAAYKHFRQFVLPQSWGSLFSCAAWIKCLMWVWHGERQESKSEQTNPMHVRTKLKNITFLSLYWPPPLSPLTSHGLFPHVILNEFHYHLLYPMGHAMVVFLVGQPPDWRLEATRLYYRKSFLGHLLNFCCCCCCWCNLGPCLEALVSCI